MNYKLGMDAAQIRRENLRLLAKQLGGQARLAEKLGKSEAQISALFSDNQQAKRNIGTRLARQIEQRLGKPHGWLDHQQKEDYFDQDLLIKSVELVEGALRAERLEVSPEKRARLYFEALKRLRAGLVDSADIRELVRLAA